MGFVSSLLTVICCYKVASRIADHGDVEVFESGDDILAETVGIGQVVSWIVYAAIYASSHMSDDSVDVSGQAAGW